MATSKAWFVEQRAENLAIVLLTRFPVVVTREPDDRGLDLRVLLDAPKPGLREFGVEVKGTTQLRQLVDERNNLRRTALRASQRAVQDCPFPVALMVFDVATDAGLFGWLLAPVIREGKAGLAKPEPLSLDSATNERIAEALSEVRAWYDARPWRIDKEVAHHS